uniref:Uncharacterized protein n=1 Tax=Arundo donax TaxID=35708 RepID=A0A0A9FL03_ARUDO
MWSLLSSLFLHIIPTSGRMWLEDWLWFSISSTTYSKGSCNKELKELRIPFSILPVTSGTRVASMSA